MNIDLLCFFTMQFTTCKSFSFFWCWTDSTFFLFRTSYNGVDKTCFILDMIFFFLVCNKTKYLCEAVQNNVLNDVR